MTIKYPSIEQFKNVIKDVTSKTRYVETVNGVPVFSDKPLPTLHFIGSPKVHGCFEKNTQITLANGETSLISQIRPGTYVLSYDTKNKIESVKQVLKVFHENNDKKSWCKLTFNDRQLICTKDHLIYTQNRGWIEAQYLLMDDVFVEDST